MCSNTAHRMASRDLKPLTVDSFHLQQMEEAFRAGIVVSVALGTHAAPQLVPDDQRLIGALAQKICFLSHF